MSAYGHEMERQISAQTLSSRPTSEMGSRYTTEDGIFMSAFAATVFISGLVIVGVSLVSLLVALAIMLQTCERKNSGLIDMYGYSKDYDYCRNFALQIELNCLGQDSLPVKCKDVDTLYVKGGLYEKDLSITIGIVEDFFRNGNPQKDGRDVVLMDADDLISEPSFTSMYRIKEVTSHGSSSSYAADNLKHIFLKKMYLKLQSDGWPLILFSRKPEQLYNGSVQFLISSGCQGWSAIIMRKEDEMEVEFKVFLSRQITMLHGEGYRIASVISSRMDVLAGTSVGRLFKLPSPILGYSFQGKE